MLQNFSLVVNWKICLSKLIWFSNKSSTHRVSYKLDNMLIASGSFLFRRQRLVDKIDWRLEKTECLNCRPNIKMIRVRMSGQFCTAKTELFLCKDFLIVTNTLKHNLFISCKGCFYSFLKRSRMFHCKYGKWNFVFIETFWPTGHPKKVTNR